MPILTEVAQGKRDIFNLYGNDYETLDGSCIRDFIHIEDLASAHAVAVNYAAQMKNQTTIFNLGTGYGTTVVEIIRAFEIVAQVAIPVTINPRRAGDAAAVYASCDRAKQEFGWHPTRGMQDMLQSSWHAYQRNQKIGK